jgi:hypothetical protein
MMTDYDDFDFQLGDLVRPNRFLAGLYMIATGRDMMHMFDLCGMIVEVDAEKGYYVEWEDGTQGWCEGTGIELVSEAPPEDTNG